MEIDEHSGTHSYKVKWGGQVAALAKHDGLNTEIIDREVRKMCKRCGKDGAWFLEQLRGGK